jgi:predicted RNase H-like HicB family nuclease
MGEAINAAASRYSMLIEWSDEDQAYIVTLPEWEAAHYMGNIHGSTRAAALAAGEELIESWLEHVQQEGETPPPARIFDSKAGAGV